MRNFGIPNVTSRPASGAQPLTGSHYDADTRADNIVRLADYTPGRLNSGRLTAASLFIPADPPFPRGYLAQALIDVLTLIVWTVIGCIAAIVVGGPFLALGAFLFFD